MVAALRGFTLAELLLSLGLISLALLALVGVLSICLRSSTQNRQAIQAGQLCQQLFENIRQQGSCPTSNVDYNGQPALQGFPPAPYPAVQVEDTDYRLTVSSQPVASRAHLYSVRVHVSCSRHEGNYECVFYQP